MKAREKIMAVLGPAPGKTVTQIADDLDLTQKTVRDRLADLKTEGRVFCTTNGRDHSGPDPTHWYRETKPTDPELLTLLFTSNYRRKPQNWRSPTSPRKPESGEQR